MQICYWNMEYTLGSTFPRKNKFDFFLLFYSHDFSICKTDRFHYKSWRDWRRRNQEIRLMVKHRSDEDHFKTLEIWINRRDGNNNRTSIPEIPPRMNRWTSWLGMPPAHTSESIFAIHQTSFV